jgi:hypothetical protein
LPIFTWHVTVFGLTIWQQCWSKITLTVNPHGKGSEMTYGELAKELGFEEDFNAFISWANLGIVSPDYTVSAGEVALLRQAMSHEIARAVAESPREE